ncbi:amidohydrolase family protein [Leucobacter sp. CSA1]|uniref:Amidohydrolase family protein n=1 Tax=Leucobacter chromiisoli TaxID=2796471 RepID=A0A934QB95_9MICO|nr:amidohydrolase family protein [Leucobacter chromiisoli]MBK0420132.1 amidohydrolase family protein [Leucobacter chromiisoli]
MSATGTAPRGAELLFVGGRIFGEGDGETPVEAMRVLNGRVESLGEAGRLREECGPGAEEIDLGGGVVLPGFIDAHTHVEFSAMARYDWVDVRGDSPERICERLRAEVDRVADSERWVVAQGTFLQALPDREALDRVSATVPLLVRESMHRLQANTEALRRAGFLDRAPTTAPGVVVHVDERRRPTGLVEEGFHLFPVPGPGPERLESFLERELRESFARHGVTTVYEIPATAAGVDAYAALAGRRALPVRITLTPVVAPGLNPLLGAVSEWREWAGRFPGGPGLPLLSAGGIKIFVDGDNEQAFDTTTFERSPRGWGAVTRTLAQLRDELAWAAENDVQVWVHAIGDLAQDLVLEAVEQARERVGPPALPTRLEHAANLQLTPRLVDRMAALDVVPVPTANFMATDDGSGLYAYRTLSEAGFRPPGNSDTGGAIAEAPNPWFGIAHMMDRRNARGVPVAPQERVPALEGVRGYTRYAAAVAGLEGEMGRLAPGCSADFAVYEQDPRALDAERMRAVEAEQTFVEGRRTWRRER